MLKLFKVLKYNNKQLVDLLKISMVYKSNFILDNLKTNILKLENSSDIGRLNNILEAKILKIKQNSEDNMSSNISKTINKLKLKEFTLEFKNNNSNCLIISNKYIKKITAINTRVLLDNCCNLTFLTLTSCKIENITNIALLIDLLNTNMLNLDTLILSKIIFNQDENRFLKIKLKNIKKLVINEIELYNIVINTSKRCKLLSLELTRNNLYHLDVSSLVNLKFLNLFGNSVNNIDCSKLTSLIKLDLTFNKLKTLDISNLSNLEELELDVNEIEEINMDSLINLKKLVISRNKLTNLNLSNLVNLTFLDTILNESLESLNLVNSKNISDLMVDYKIIKNIYRCICKTIIS